MFQSEGSEWSLSMEADSSHIYLAALSSVVCCSGLELVWSLVTILTRKYQHCTVSW